jgi:hypothetical protein
MTVAPPLLPAAYRLVSRETLGSTNDEATRLAREGAAEGTVIWAVEQDRRARASRPPLVVAARQPLRLADRAPGLPARRAAQHGFVVASSDAGAARMFGRHQPEIGHQLARVGKAREVAQFGDQGCGALTSAMPRIVCSAGATGASVQSGSIAAICAVSRSRRASAISTA